jgi:hypothetical protein
MLWNQNIKKYTSSYLGFETADYYLPLLRYFGRWKELQSIINVVIERNNESLRNKGFKSFDYEWNDDFKKAKEQMESYEIKLHKESITLFEQYIQECQQNNIELILINTPEYIEGQSFIKGRDKVLSIYKELADKYGIQFLDYSNDDLSYNKSLFYNTMHMNSKGSNKLTKSLVQWIK